ncbi:hypothetical protein [Nocardiopsis algeriensis]|uniref:Uncharacterized protein n=1 Tax=Nocardiopsis algeriensis TaxID=1478215 RepID=A0A841IR18_9ACTN|nr:hypothetical protein [Nocardiopsis algeriensis]MBB6120664.1 hypothetical protein [Nocardiopsis algeriensis]
MANTHKSLDDFVREELGEEPSQEAMDYARRLYERYRLPADSARGGTGGREDPGDGLREGPRGNDEEGG